MSLFHLSFGIHIYPITKSRQVEHILKEHLLYSKAQSGKCVNLTAILALTRTILTCWLLLVSIYTADGNLPVVAVVK